jgi:hypothetical protein
VGTTTIASGTTNYLLYNNGGTLGNEAVSSLSIAYSQLTGSVPTWNQNTTGNAATATSATNIAGGATYNIPYQVGVGSTSFFVDVANAVVCTSGSGLPSECTTLPSALTIPGPTLSGTASVADTSSSTIGLLVENTTAATSGANQSSSQLAVSAQYWNGSATATDEWTVQDVLGTGTNPNSTLTFVHTGSSGTATVSLPASTTINGTSCSLGGSCTIAAGPVGTLEYVNCLTTACQGGISCPTTSTYAASTTYTNCSAYAVTEYVVMVGSGSCAGADSVIQGFVNSVAITSNGFDNSCGNSFYGKGISFVVPSGATFSVTVTHIDGGGSYSVGSWWELYTFIDT